MEPVYLHRQRKRKQLNCYQHQLLLKVFVHSLAKPTITEPLVNLTRKGVKFKWTDSCQHSFEKLKNVLTSEQVMAHPDPTRPHMLYMDACDVAIGAILTQKNDEGKLRVVQYISHSLPVVQRRWATIEKEAYAVVYALQKLRPYLMGADFTIYTDHKPLKSLFTKTMANTKIQRWAILLAEYGAQIEYIRGPNNVKADALSWLEGSSPLPEVPIAPITRAHKRNLEVPLSEEDHDLIDLDINPEEFRNLQRQEFADLIAEAVDPESDSDYVIDHGKLYSDCPPYCRV